MSDLPKARELVAKAAGMLPRDNPAREILHDALPLMMRERPMKRVGARSQPLTMAVACSIWRYYRKHPDASSQAIGTALDVNQGRVSEVLNGLRYPRARKLSLYKDFK